MWLKKTLFCVLMFAVLLMATGHAQDARPSFRVVGGYVYSDGGIEGPLFGHAELRSNGNYWVRFEGRSSTAVLKNPSLPNQSPIVSLGDYRNYYEQHLATVVDYVVGDTMIHLEFSSERYFLFVSPSTEWATVIAAFDELGVTPLLNRNDVVGRLQRLFERTR